MKKIKKILFTIVLSLILMYNTSASVKEDASTFTEDTYIIGITKFNNNVIVNASMANQAGIDYARFMSSINITDLTSDVFFYSKLTDEWFRITKDTKEYKLLSEDEVETLLNNLNILYVNNEEKNIEFEYNGIPSNISNDNIKFENNKFIIPATTLYFGFDDENGEYTSIKLISDSNGNYTLDSYYISYRGQLFDYNGAFVSGMSTNELGLYNLKFIEFPNKEGTILKFTLENGEEIDINTYKPNKSGIKIYEKLISVGSLMEMENAIYNKETRTLKYTGVINREGDTNYLDVTVLAPEGFSTIRTLVHGNSVNWTYGVRRSTVVRLNITDKSNQTITVKWDDRDTTTFTVDLSESKFLYNITYKEYSNVKRVDTITEGSTITNIYPYTKNKYVLTGITAIKNGSLLFDTTTPITKDYIFYPVYGTAVLSYKNDISSEVEYAFTSGEESIQKFRLSYSKIKNGTFKLYVKFNDDSDIYDENNYIKANIGDEWYNFNEGVTFRATDYSYTDIVFKVKMTTNTSTLLKYIVYYNDEYLTEGTIVNGLAREEDIVFSIGDAKFTSLKAKKIFNYGSALNPVTLLKDVTLNGTVSIDNESSVNLNGHTLTSSNSNSMFEFITNNQSNDASLYIFNGKLVSVSNNPETYVIKGGNKTGKGRFDLTMSYVEVTSNNESIYVSGTGSSVSLNNVTINSKNNALFIEGNSQSIVLENTILYTDGTAIMTNGSTSKDVNMYLINTTIESKKLGIYKASSGVLSIENSNIKGTTGIGIKSGTTTIDNSKITGDNTNPDPHENNDNGINDTGDAIFIEVNKNYQGVTESDADIDVVLTDTQLYSRNSRGYFVLNPDNIPGVEVKEFTSPDSN